MLAWGIVLILVGSACELAGIVLGALEIRAAARATRKFLSSEGALFKVVASFPVAWNVLGSAALSGGRHPDAGDRCDRLEARLAETEAKLGDLENRWQAAKDESERSVERFKQAVGAYVAESKRGALPWIAVALLAVGAVLQAIGGVLAAVAPGH